MESIINLVLLFLVYYKVTLDYWGSVLKQEVNNNYWVCNKLFHHMMCVYIMRAYIFGKKKQIYSHLHSFCFFQELLQKANQSRFLWGFLIFFSLSVLVAVVVYDVLTSPNIRGMLIN